MVPGVGQAWITLNLKFNKSLLVFAFGGGGGARVGSELGASWPLVAGLQLKLQKENPKAWDLGFRGLDKISNI